MAAALPCPPLPDTHAAAAAADVRAGPQSGAAANSCPVGNGLMANGGPPVRAPRAPPFTTLTAEWSPGISSGALTPNSSLTTGLMLIEQRGPGERLRAFQGASPWAGRGEGGGGGAADFPHIAQNVSTMQLDRQYQA